MDYDIHIIGPYPPPYGGVSTHIYRLRERLLRDGHGCSVWCFQHDPDRRLYATHKIRQTLRDLLNVDPRAIFHFHSNHRLAGLLAKAGRKVIFTVHNERINSVFTGGVSLRQRWLKRRGRASFRNVQTLIAVSDSATTELLRFGFSKQRIRTFSAYLRPEVTEQPHQQSQRDFNLFRDKFQFVLSACATDLNFHKGEDLYGIDLCIELVGHLASEQCNLGLVLAIPMGKGSAYLHSLQARAEQLGISGRILWLLEPGAFHPLLKRCDLFLRPTNTDGFSISVAEALECDTPVVASDAVQRPPGCLTFKNRDFDDLVNKVTFALDHLGEMEAVASGFHVADNYDNILKVYETVNGAGLN
ncbi:MAG: glycosyltransferase family 4 protein [Desulfuromonadales bacterium]|nr:glycosyltransferase family 4 protein [Desulfuromonadales bacterium]